jgi:phospholipase/carboxylesterase
VPDTEEAGVPAGGQPLRRRAFLRSAAVVLPGIAVAGCTPGPTVSTAGTSSNPSPAEDGAARLTARPAAAGTTTAAYPPGLHALDLGSGPEVLLQVPADDDGTEPARLVLALHGAGESAQDGLAPLLGQAQAHRLLLLAPKSQGTSWDAIMSDWGPDVRRIDLALTQVLAAHPVDATRLTISGFSDGASYALSLGLANADLFTHVIAFSPGFLVAGPRVGMPRVYVTHGLADRVLPVDQATRRIVAQLDAAKIPTEVRVFDGGHTVPSDIAEGAVRWLLT